MEVPAADQHDGLSDYGSDFTPDEEEILKGLLQRVPDNGDNPTTDPDQRLKDIEDNEGPRGMRMPRRFGREQFVSENVSTDTPEKRMVTIQFDGDITPSKDGMYRVAQAASTD